MKFFCGNKKNCRTWRITLFSEEFKIKIYARKMQLGGVMIQNSKSIACYSYN